MSRTDKDIPTWVKRTRGAQDGHGTQHRALLIGGWLNSYSWMGVSRIPGTDGRYADHCTCNEIARYTYSDGRWVLNPDDPAAERIYAPCIPLWYYPSDDTGDYRRGRRMRPVADRANTRDYLHATLGFTRRGDTTDIAELSPLMPPGSRRCICCH